jgi:hypothetical protein
MWPHMLPAELKVHAMMRREAKRLAEVMLTRSSTFRALASDSNLTQRLIEMVFKDPSTIPKDELDHVTICCASVEGFCYMAAMDHGEMAGCSVLRCLQFTKYMDEALHARGLPVGSKN